ncbi:MAG: glycosyltransferase family 39 protein [Kiritimatiellae bacterium]|nr:glycosyltransferase family 39 protein [Kiritimatiellia bacterium]
MPQRAWRPILLVVLGGLALRLLYVWQTLGSEYFGCPVLDQLEFLLLGRAAAERGLSGLGVIWRPPLYPLFLGAVLRLFESEAAVLVLQAVLSSATVFVLYLAARRFMRPAVALAGAALYAAHWISIFFCAQFLNTTLFTFLGVTAVWLLLASEARRRILLALAGVAAGLAALTWPTVLPCAGAWALWVLFARRDIRPAQRVVNAGVLLVGVALAISPVTFHNYRVTGRFIPITAIGGYNLFVGNNAESDGKTVWASTRTLTELKVSDKGDPLDNQALYTRAVREWARSNPGAFLKLAVKKTYYLASSYEIPSNIDIYYAISATSFVLALLALLSFGILFPLAVTGILFARDRRGKAGPAVLFLAVLSATIVLFFVNARFRAPLLPFLCVYAAAGAEALWRARLRLHKEGLPMLVVLALLLAVSNSRLFGVADPRDTIEVNTRQAYAFFVKGRYQAARTMAENVLFIDPQAEMARALCKQLPPE